MPGQDSCEESERVLERRVGSWSELNELLYEGSYDPQLERYRSPYAFRGLSCAGRGGLATSLSRLSAQPDKLEGHLLRNFRKYAHRDAVPFDSVWNWLALAQHHGLPTRLLDWSYSPLVAMHFATVELESMDRDGLIWCLDHVGVERYLPGALRQILAREGSDVFTVEMLKELAGDLPTFDALSPEAFVVFLEPPSLDERIISQSALFSLMSDPSANLEEWLSDKPGLVRQLVLPASLKWEIRDKLDQAGITERILFPGLDGLTRWLRRYYSSKR
jgi:hypothetical protein